MRQLWISVAILAGMVLLLSWNMVHVHQLTEPMREDLSQAVAAAREEDWQKAEFMENGNHKVKIRIVYDRKSRIILGAQMCSDYDVSMGIHMFSMAVEEQVTIDKLKLFDLFFLPHFNKPYNYVTMAALGAE